METPFSNSILYANGDLTVVLLDIIASLSLAQGCNPNVPLPRMQSSNHLREPYCSAEPQSEEAKARVKARMDVCSGEDVYREIIRQSLGHIKQSHTGPWNIQQITSPELGHQRLPTTSEQSENNTEGTLRHTGRFTPSPSSVEMKPCRGVLTDIPAPAFTPRLQHRRVSKPISLSPGASNNYANDKDIASRVVINASSKSTLLAIIDRDIRYLIPPKSTFLWHDIAFSGCGVDAGLKRIFLDNLPGCTASAYHGQFDAVIMDPPWSNRSAKRKGIYHTPATGPSPERDPFRVLEGFLADHIAPSGLVLCWITHKRGIRQVVRRAFTRWGVDLVEEWVWAKVTTRGEPVYDLEGIWRRPWEVCLVGRRREDGCICQAEVDDTEVDINKQIKRRVVVAVPEAHSRKPCLRELLSRMLPNHSDVRVIEIFARHLTAGWWALGDQVLKYQLENYWMTDTKQNILPT